jgi:hypothetical protein
LGTQSATKKGWPIAGAEALPPILQVMRWRAAVSLIWNGVFRPKSRYFDRRNWLIQRHLILSTPGVQVGNMKGGGHE